MSSLNEGSMTVGSGYVDDRIIYSAIDIPVKIEVQEKEDPLFSTNIALRQISSKYFEMILKFAVIVSVGILFVLLYSVCSEGLRWFTWNFLSSFPSRFAEKAGVLSALVGSLWVMGLTAVVSIPVGIGAGVYMEEFAPRGKFFSFLSLNIANLAGVPSIVYGILGLTLFVRTFALGRGILAGSLTLAIMILPIIIVTTREAIKAVPQSLRHGALALGATTWETTRSHVLPAAFPGIMTGIILALSRAMGETAPLIMLGAFTYVAFLPTNIMDAFTVLPIQIFNWASRPNDAFHGVASAGIICLLIILLTFNSFAVFTRMYLNRNYRW